MITRIEINGFKTFHNFIMEFTPFTVVAGANASGKSNLFDALKLLSRLAETDIKTAFNSTNLRGDAIEQFSQLANGNYAQRMSFAAEMLLDYEIKDNWGGLAKLKYTRLRYELEIQRQRNSKGFDDLFVTKEVLQPIKHQEDKWVRKHIRKAILESWRPKVFGRRGVPYIKTEEKENKLVIKIPQDGKPGQGKIILAQNVSQTLLSSINSVDFPHVFAAKNEMMNWRFLQLNPEELSKPSPRTASDTLTQNGGNLAAALYRLKQDDEKILKDISRELGNLLPNFTKVDVTEDKAENKFVINLISDDGRVFSSRVLSEGTLRLLILCVMKFDPKNKGTLCFEEPENGIHPYRISLMIDLLQGLSTDLFDKDDVGFPIRQVIVNTHSAVFVGNVFKNLQLMDNVSVWFSKLITNKLKVDGQNLMFKATKILPVSKSNAQLEFDFVTQNEMQMTDLEVKKYLETQGFENKS